jgi:hypothetical protein
MPIVKRSDAQEGEARHSTFLVLVSPGSKQHPMLQIEDASVFDDTSGFERQRGSFHQHAKMRPIREFHEVQRAAWRLVLIKHTGEKDGRG